MPEILKREKSLQFSSLIFQLHNTLMILVLEGNDDIGRWIGLCKEGVFCSIYKMKTKHPILPDKISLDLKKLCLLYTLLLFDRFDHRKASTISQEFK